MPVYETIAADDLESVLWQFAPCWRNVAFRGVAYRDMGQGDWLPLAMQVHDSAWSGSMTPRFCARRTTFTPPSTRPTKPR